MAKLAPVIVLICVAVWAAFVTDGCVQSGSSSPPSGPLDLNVELGKTTPTDVQSQMSKFGFQLESGHTTYQERGITLQVFRRSSDGKVVGVYIRAVPGAPQLGLAGVHVGDTRSKVESVLGPATHEEYHLTTYKSPQPGTILNVMYSPTSGEGIMIISFKLEGEDIPTPY